ncbi:MAG: glycosyltransferase [Nitrospinota bacterium]
MLLRDHDIEMHLMFGIDSSDRGPKRWGKSTVHFYPRRERRNLKRYILRAMDTIRPDIIQVRNSVSTGMTALRLAREKGTRFVFRESFSNLLRREFELRNGFKKGWWYKKYLLALQNRALRKLYEASDLVIPLSETMANRIRTIAPRARVFIVPNGYDPALVQAALRRPSPLGLRLPPRYLLYFGTMEPLRKLEKLAPVLGNLSKRFPDLHLVFMGSIERSYRVEMTRHFESECCSGRVVFTGPVQRADVFRAIEKAEIVLSPIDGTPVFEISCPLKLIEAMGVGSVIAATDIPEQRKLIEAGRCGRVVKYETAAFAQAIADLLGLKEEEKKSMKLSGRRFAQSHRDYRKIAEKLAAVYHCLVTQGGETASRLPGIY